MPRWIRFTGLGVAALVSTAVVLGSGYEAAMRRRTAREFPPPGRMVDIGGRSMELDCRGDGSPLVVLESGLDMSGPLSWALVHDAIAATTRTCAYSRAGILWSDESSGPQHASTVAADLKATLAAAGEGGPYVLVGHSIGGPYVMAFTWRYRSDVAGLVFVDASHPDQRQRFHSVVGDRTDPRFGVERIGAALAWSGLVRLALPRAAEGKLPAEAYAAIMAHVPTSLGSMLKEADGLETTFAEAGSFRQLGDLPLVVLTAMAPLSEPQLAAMQLTAEEGNRYQSTWRALHEEEASWSSRGEHIVVPDATHYIQIDRPDVVIAAVQRVVAMVRADQGR